MCNHENIVLVTEKPSEEIDGILYFQADKFFVECEDCHQVLPIRRVTKEQRDVPLILSDD